MKNNMHYYIFGDIHANLDALVGCTRKVLKLIEKNDIMIFLGDYIDRGGHSYEVIEYLLAIKKKYNTVFLMGNHEDMLLKYLDGNDPGGMYLHNGGTATIRSYRKHCKKFEIPQKHLEFLRHLELYYEGSDFIAVHAGLDPKIDVLDSQDTESLLWIRERFYRAQKRWNKTIIFGHTPINSLTKNAVYDDKERNIIGIDSGAIYGYHLTCLRWPDKKIITGK